MGIFGSIMDKIFHHKAANTGASAPGESTQPPAAPAAAPQAPAAAPTPAPVTVQDIDVEAVLTEMATMKEGGNWRTSIVDLLKLLDLDSSLSARKALAQELDVHAGDDGSAEQNIALQKAVMRKLAENGGVVPDSLRD